MRWWHVLFLLPGLAYSLVVVYLGLLAAPADQPGLLAVLTMAALSLGPLVLLVWRPTRWPAVWFTVGAVVGTITLVLLGLLVVFGHKMVMGW